jgi:hypothetical protein
VPHLGLGEALQQASADGTPAGLGVAQASGVVKSAKEKNRQACSPSVSQADIEDEIQSTHGELLYGNFNAVNCPL